MGSTGGRILMAVLFAALAACSSAPPVGPEFAGVQYPADNSKAHIYIYRKGVRWASNNSWILALDGLPLTTLSPDSYILIDIVPGEIEFSADHIRHLHPLDYLSSGSSASDIFTAVDVAEQARINAEEEFVPLLKRNFRGGQIYFYKLDTTFSAPGVYPAPTLVEVNEAQALEELEGLGLAGPPE